MAGQGEAHNRFRWEKVATKRNSSGGRLANGKGVAVSILKGKLITYNEVYVSKISGICKFVC
jgi:hypothetical protein